MSEVTFNIYYSGPALESGRMDVRELAPALLAIGGLLEESNRVLNGKRARVTVNVKKFEDGSFGISFDVIQSLTDQFVTLFSGDTVTAAINLLETIGFVSGATFSLYKLLKIARGRMVKSVKKLEDGNIEIDFSDDNDEKTESVQVNSKIFNLFRDLKVRQEVENTVKPLEREGINEFEVRHKKEVVECIKKDEISYYCAPEVEDEEIDEHETIATFSIHSLSFKEDNKWRLSDGTNTFLVTIKDQEFLRKVDKDLISFSKGDLLRIRLVVKSFETLKGLKTEYEAIEILDHKSAFKQIPLPIESK